MPESHPSPGQLEEFFRGSLPRERMGSIIRHLLAGCPQCSSAATAHWPPPPRSEAALESSFDRALGRLREQPKALAAERAAAPALFEELQRHPPVRQLVLARNSRRFRSWPLAELVLESALEAGFEDPPAALELAELGVALAEALRETTCPRRLVNDLRARALATRGNARRIGGDLGGAEGDLAAAAELLGEGTADPLEEAFVLQRVACLRMDRRQFPEAMRAFDGALALYRLTGETHAVGRTLIDKGLASGYAGDPDAAIRLIESGLARLDPARDPRTALAAKHNLALFRCERGDLDRATSLVKELLPLYAARRERLSLLRLRWLEGKLAQAQRRLPQAEEAFLEVQSAFLERQLGYDAALVTLDLAQVYLEQGRIADLQLLAAQVLPVFCSLDIHREALVALTLFKRAVDMQEVTLRWIHELSAYLELARSNPKLSFQPPARPRLG